MARSIKPTGDAMFVMRGDKLFGEVSGDETLLVIGSAKRRRYVNVCDKHGRVVASFAGEKTLEALARALVRKAER